LHVKELCPISTSAVVVANVTYSSEASAAARPI
jgi:hypothetical protein